MQTYMSNGHDFPGGSDAQDEKPEVEHKMVEVLGQMATAIQALGEGAQALKAKPLPAELRASMKTKDQELDATIFGANETYLEHIQERLDSVHAHDLTEVRHNAELQDYVSSPLTVAIKNDYLTVRSGDDMVGASAAEGTQCCLLQHDVTAALVESYAHRKSANPTAPVLRQLATTARSNELGQRQHTTEWQRLHSRVPKVTIGDNETPFPRPAQLHQARFEAVKKNAARGDLLAAKVLKIAKTASGLSREACDWHKCTAVVTEFLYTKADLLRDSFPGSETEKDTAWLNLTGLLQTNMRLALQVNQVINFDVHQAILSAADLEAQVQYNAHERVPSNNNNEHFDDPLEDTHKALEREKAASGLTPKDGIGADSGIFEDPSVRESKKSRKKAAAARKASAATEKDTATDKGKDRTRNTKRKFKK